MLNALPGHVLEPWAGMLLPWAGRCLHRLYRLGVAPEARPQRQPDSDQSEHLPLIRHDADRNLDQGRLIGLDRLAQLRAQLGRGFGPATRDAEGFGQRHVVGIDEIGWRSRDRRIAGAWIGLTLP